jgi:hypothetical protein
MAAAGEWIQRRTDKNDFVFYVIEAEQPNWLPAFLYFAKREGYNLPYTQVRPEELAHLRATLPLSGRRPLLFCPSVLLGALGETLPSLGLKLDESPSVGALYLLETPPRELQALHSEPSPERGFEARAALSPALKPRHADRDFPRGNATADLRRGALGQALFDVFGEAEEEARSTHKAPFARTEERRVVFGVSLLFFPGAADDRGDHRYLSVRETVELSFEHDVGRVPVAVKEIDARTNVDEPRREGDRLANLGGSVGLEPPQKRLG